MLAACTRVVNYCQREKDRRFVSLEMHIALTRRSLAQGYRCSPAACFSVLMEERHKSILHYSVPWLGAVQVYKARSTVCVMGIASAEFGLRACVQRGIQHTEWIMNKCIHELTPQSRVLPEKRTGPQVVKKFPAFYGTRRFITAFTTAPYPDLDRSTPCPPALVSKIRFKIILPSTPGNE